MKARRVSVAEAKNNLPALIHEAESSRRPVEITRRGKTVAILVSSAAYEERKPTLVDELAEIFGRHDASRFSDEEIASLRADVTARDFSLGKGRR